MEKLALFKGGLSEWARNAGRDRPQGSWWKQPQHQPEQVPQQTAQPQHQPEQAPQPVQPRKPRSKFFDYTKMGYTGLDRDGFGLTGMPEQAPQPVQPRKPRSKFFDYTKMGYTGLDRDGFGLTGMPPKYGQQPEQPQTSGWSQSPAQAPQPVQLNSMWSRIIQGAYQKGAERMQSPAYQRFQQRFRTADGQVDWDKYRHWLMY